MNEPISFSKTFDIQWADLDPNFHVRHSVYYDWAATTRIHFLNKLGIDPSFMVQHQFGPILFREEAIFKKEIRFGDSVQVTVHLQKARKDFSRWSWIHAILKNNDVLAATVQVDGAFIHTALRKLTAPPEEVMALLNQVPRSDDFSWTE